MTEEILRIPFEDLTRISFKCSGKCGTEITLDMSVNDQPKTARSFDWKKPQDLPQCPMCGTSLSSSLRSFLAIFAEWFKKDQKIEETEVCFPVLRPRH